MRVRSPAPCTTRTSRISLKGVSRRPKPTAASTVPTSSIMQSSATTFGRARSGARSVASARPAVWVVCIPAPVIRKARAAPACPTMGGPWLSPERRIRAKGMIASPPN